jgi:siroheme synthase
MCRVLVRNCRDSLPEKRVLNLSRGNPFLQGKVVNKEAAQMSNNIETGVLPSMSELGKLLESKAKAVEFVFDWFRKIPPRGLK